MRVWLITAEAVYDHGIGGIFTSRESAIAHAERLLAGGDDHHHLRVEEVEVDVPLDLPVLRSVYGVQHDASGNALQVREWPGNFLVDGSPRGE